MAPSASPDLRSFTGYLLRRAHVQAVGAEQACIGDDTRMREIAVLVILDELGAVSQREVAALTHISPTVMVRLVDGLERGLATTNMDFRAGFPVGECLAYARPLIRGGTDTVVFGHFHDERRLQIQEKKRQGTVFVLPAWRDGHRYLRLTPGAEPAFVSS